jgi:hypothetical protein
MGRRLQLPAEALPMRMMVLVVVLVAIVAVPATAQQFPVVVTTTTGETVRGRLLAITEERVTLSREGRLDPIPLAAIERIVKPRDPVGDGLLKGVAIGALALFACIEACEAGYIASSMIGWGLIGAAIDAVQADSFVVYDRTASDAFHPRAASAVAVKIRF